MRTDVKRSTVDASQLSNRLKHSDVRESVDLRPEERKNKTGIIYSYTSGRLSSGGNSSTFIWGMKFRKEEYIWGLRF